MSESINKTYGNRLRVRACGIFIKNDKLLLIRHKGIGPKGELWVPPGGGVSFGEDAQTALQREFREETGLLVQVGELLFVNEFISNNLHALELFFNIKTAHGNIKTGTDPEHSEEDQIIEEVKFVTFQEIKVIDNEKKHNILHKTNTAESLLNMRGYFNFCL